MKTRIILGALCACQFIAAAPLMAATDQQSSGTLSAAAGMSSKTAKDVTQLTGSLLRQVDAARHSILTHDKQAASNDIDKALADRAKLASLAKSDRLGSVIPLYSEFDEDSTLAPVMAARKKAPPSRAPAAANSYTPITVDQVAGAFTFIGLDLHKARARLEAAKTALANNNEQAASDSLAAVEDDLIMESDQVNLPLLAARENLGIAGNAVKDGHAREASACLKQASEDLNQFAGSAQAQHAEQAKTLSEKIASFAQSLNRNESNASTKIDGWWHEVDGWFDRPAAQS